MSYTDSESVCQRTMSDDPDIEASLNAELGIGINENHFSQPEGWFGLTSEEELQLAINRCKDLILETPEKSERRSLLVKKLVQLRLRLQELQDGVVLPPETKLVLGHRMEKQNSIRTGHLYCEHCCHLIWGLVSHCMQDLNDVVNGTLVEWLESVCGKFQSHIMQECEGCHGRGHIYMQDSNYEFLDMRDTSKSSETVHLVHSHIDNIEKVLQKIRTKSLTQLPLQQSLPNGRRTNSKRSSSSTSHALMKTHAGIERDGNSELGMLISELQDNGDPIIMAWLPTDEDVTSWGYLEPKGRATARRLALFLVNLGKNVTTRTTRAKAGVETASATMCDCKLAYAMCNCPSEPPLGFSGVGISRGEGDCTCGGRPACTCPCAIQYRSKQSTEQSALVFTMPENGDCCSYDGKHKDYTFPCDATHVPRAVPMYWLTLVLATDVGLLATSAIGRFGTSRCQCSKKNMLNEEKEKKYHVNGARAAKLACCALCVGLLALFLSVVALMLLHAHHKTIEIEQIVRHWNPSEGVQALSGLVDIEGHPICPPNTMLHIKRNPDDTEDLSPQLAPPIEEPPLSTSFVKNPMLISTEQAMKPAYFSRFLKSMLRDESHEDDAYSQQNMDDTYS
ncbi:unnamed protein product [Darwinula stevensoni]|uniref:Uncharacterized protein n=1 Tax=Darwinula stevensoni TaxID=69355 RepID=A0A7R9A4T4_9CRUS|nr:unnamed protein product [Darwinula stevensoni]CAG0884934.1 unnamed protein product [Darwinula stevensoni]